jgi:hypothetical protein
MPFSNWTSFRNFVFEFCNRRNQYIQSNFDHFLTAGTWRFIKSCLPLGATQEFYFPTSDAEVPLPVFSRNLSGDPYLRASLTDIKNRVSAYPYAIEEIKAEISYSTGNEIERSYEELITLPYWESRGKGKYWDADKFSWFPPFWTYWISTVHPDGVYLIIYSRHPTSVIIIRAIWLPTDVSAYSFLWMQYPYEIAKFTYYEVLLALSEWDEANVVWQECMKIAQEMRQQHGAKKLIIPYQQIDFLNPQAQVGVGGGGGE